MTACPGCGRPAQVGDEFCASCGSFLDWTAEGSPSEVAVPEAAVGGEARSAEEARDAAVARRESAELAVEEAIGALEAAREEERQAVAAAAALARRAVPGTTSPSPPEELRSRASALLAKRPAPVPSVPSPPAPPPPDTASDAPTAPVAVEQRNDQRSCPDCGRANDPARRLCAKCGSLLGAAAAGS